MSAITATQTGKNNSVEILLTVNKGLIENISLTPQILEKRYYDTLCKFVLGSQFSLNIYVSLEKWLESSKNNDICSFIKSCIMQVVIDVFR